MKKVAMDSQQVRASLKHQSLLQDYMELQKDYDSKKKKLQMTERKKNTLLAEIRFLRRRRNYLLEMRSLKQKMEEDSVQQQNRLMQMKLQATGATLKKGSTLTKSDSVTVGKKGNKGKKVQEEGFKKPLGAKRKAHADLMNEKIMGKKKISWQDPVAMNV